MIEGQHRAFTRRDEVDHHQQELEAGYRSGRYNIVKDADGKARYVPRRYVSDSDE